MRKTLIALLLLLFGCSTGTNVQLAQERIDWFHQRLDAGQYEAIFDATDRALPQDKLIPLLEGLHRRMGSTKSSTPTSWETAYHVSGVELTLVHKTVFERGSATETFVIRIEGGLGQIVGYRVASQRVI